MKLRRVKYNNHPVLGNLGLNFVNPATDKPYDTVIFIGENGAGKTTVLSTISDFLNCVSIKPFEYIEYEAEDTYYHITPIDDPKLCFFNRKNIATGVSEEIRSNNILGPEMMNSDRKDPRSYACVFSKARADYKVDNIKGVTTKSLDEKVHENDIEDNYTSLKQLLVDIYDQDTGDFFQKNKNGRINYEDFLPQSKMYRFSHAFATFFGNIQFDKIETLDEEKVIFFKKDGREIRIDDLSTGEKQIVYRGAYLLKNSGIMEDGTVFIDEPELSMHPLWQTKILSYFKNLYFDAAANKYKAQLFFASHSDYVLKDAMQKPNENLVIILKNEGGNIVPQHINAPIILPTITQAEINYQAFNIYSTDFHIALYGYLQTITGTNTVKSCDSYIASSHLYDPSKYNRPSSHGTTNYDTLPTLIRNHIDHPDNGYTYTDEDLKASTDFLIELIKDWKRRNP